MASNLTNPGLSSGASSSANLPPRNSANEAKGKATFGKFWQAPKQKSSSKKTVVGNPSSKGDSTSALKTLRLQVRLENGLFTEALKEELLGGLEQLLYQLPPNSFIPSFNGCGLRYGKVWFSPDNQASRDWLKLKLTEINERSVLKLIIEDWSLHQNKICLNIPASGSSKERISDRDVLGKLHFQNQWAQIDRWSAVNGLTTNKGNRLIFVTVDDESVTLLDNHKWKLNYRFQKVIARLLDQKRSTT